MFSLVHELGQTRRELIQVKEQLRSVSEWLTYRDVLNYSNDCYS